MKRRGGPGEIFLRQSPQDLGVSVEGEEEERGAVQEVAERGMWKAGGATVRVKVPGRMSFPDASWQSPRQVAPAKGGRPPSV